MNIDLTIKNYRCFSRIVPAHLKLKAGIVALVGTNNSGTSSLLRFFYEEIGVVEVGADRWCPPGCETSFSYRRALSRLLFSHSGVSRMNQDYWPRRAVCRAIRTPDLSIRQTIAGGVTRVLPRRAACLPDR